jgi:hypothetical protein
MKFYMLLLLMSVFVGLSYLPLHREAKQRPATQDWPGFDE